jgi:ubiquinone/menaquinone biosynthesis C-methylase UbiE
VNKAFSIKAKVYDSYSEQNVIVKLGRRAVYQEILKNLKKDHKILELNSGTGMDALFFASQGYRIHATDISDGMISKIRKKIKKTSLKTFSCQRLSLNDLQKVENAPYDYIFSNFGGLNCIPNIDNFGRSINQTVLKPGGYITLVVMPPICPWELLNFPWNFRAAFRRLPSLWGRETISHIDGIYFYSYYYSAKSIVNSFGKNFKNISLRSISLFSPPSFMDFFPRKYPKMFEFLVKLDNRLTSSFPFNNFGDFFIITLQYIPRTR